MPWINPADFVDTTEDEFVTLAELDTRTQGYGRGRGRGRKKPTKKGKPGTYSDIVSDPRGSSGSRGRNAADEAFWRDFAYQGSDEQFWTDFAYGENVAPPPPSGSLAGASRPALQVLFGNRPRRGQKKKKPKGR